jgi:thiol-disulfide isomerase/thioredoxin
MKRWLAFCLLIAAPVAADVAKGQRAARIDLPGLDGKRVKLDALRGKVVVLDFWASWCAPCRDELPELERLKALYESRGVAFVTVNIDIDRGNAESTARKLKLTMPIALDPKGDQAANAYGLPTMPTSYVIDKGGVVRFIHEGFHGTSDVEKLKREIDELLRP